VVRADTAAANHLHHWVRRSSLAVDGLQVLSFLGRPPWLAALVLVAVVVLWRRQRHRLAVWLVVTGISGGLVDTAVKLAVDRPRPSLSDPVATALGKSFPSGHAMSSTIVYGALVLVLLPVVSGPRRVTLLAGAALLVGAIGFSRLALGVHYVSDVLGGYVLGLAWLTASTAAFGIWRRDRGGAAVGPVEAVEAEMTERRSGGGEAADSAAAIRPRAMGARP
jgi:undecaprenyl-diphosphatase